MPLWPLLIYFSSAAIMAALPLIVAYFIGERHQERATGQPYESGMVPTDSAQIRFSVRFYVVAMLFLLFVLEAMYFFAWAVSAKEAGWLGYIGILFFTAVLAVGLLYEWRQGALDLGGPGRRSVSRPRGSSASASSTQASQGGK